MPYETNWLVADRVILIRYNGTLNSEDVQQYLEETLSMRDEANTRLGDDGPLVHTITDASNLTGYSLKLTDMSAMLRSLRKQRVGWSIFVHPSRLERFWASIGHQWAGVRHRELDTMTEALMFLKEHGSLSSDEIDELLKGVPAP